MNPGQSVKDRAALFIIRDALNAGRLQPGGTVVEGTAGNTGIGLALVGNALGLKTVIVIPETQSDEKKDMLRLTGAKLIEVPAVPYKDPNNYVKYSGQARRGARRIRAERRDLGQSIRQRRQSPGPYRDDGAGDLERSRRQGRRLRLRGRHRRHARRRVDGPQGAQPGRGDRACRSDGRRALQFLQARRAQVRGQLHHRGHRPGPHHRQSRRGEDRSRPIKSPMPKRCPSFSTS